MNEPSLLILERRRGKPPLFGEPLKRRVEVLLTEEQGQRLDSVAAHAKSSLSDVVREAVNCFVSDYGERAVFERRKTYNPE